VFARLVIMINAGSGSAMKGAKGHRTDGTHGTYVYPHISLISPIGPIRLLSTRAPHSARAEIFALPAASSIRRRALIVTTPPTPLPPPHNRPIVSRAGF
jgi:hypothetical protein